MSYVQFRNKIVITIFTFYNPKTIFIIHKFLHTNKQKTSKVIRSKSKFIFISLKFSDILSKIDSQNGCKNGKYIEQINPFRNANISGKYIYN